MGQSVLVKRLPIIVGIGLIALLVFGAAIGPIVSKDEPYLEKPGVHLPAQAIFPSDERLESSKGNILGWTGIAITNSMLSSWITSVVLLGLFVAAAAKKKLVPGRLQGSVEAIVEGLLGFTESMVGPEMGRKFLPIIATIFLFVLFNAWMGLLPIYPSLGWNPTESTINESVHGDSGHHTPSRVDLLRPAGTDVNMPLALALVSFVFVEFWGIRRLGLGYFGKFVRVKGLFRGPKYWFAGAIDAFVGILEGLSEVIRLVSFTFRLFGNMLAGKILILISAFLVPFVFSVPFYGLEILVGFIQAMIFAGLTLTFATLAIAHHDE